MNTAFRTLTKFLYRLFAFLFRPAIPFLFPFLQDKRRVAIYRWPFFDQLKHMPEEESHYQRRDMAAVHIGISHYHHLEIPQFFKVKFL
jgi:hypothetical protein